MKFYYFLLLGVLLLASCNDDEVVIENEEELITTVELTLTEGQNTSVFTFTDLDGDGGDDATINTSPLAANTTYNASLTFLNETENPAEDITEEVAEEDDEHQVFYAISGVDGTTMYTDMDGDGNPLGLTFTLTTGAAGTGTLKITLRHEPEKDATGVSDGDITNAGGETDIEVDFPLVVQ